MQRFSSTRRTRAGLRAACRRDAYADAPAPTYAGGDSVPIIVVGHGVHVPVTLGGVDVEMLLDTGASISSVTTSFADQLLASGQAMELPPELVGMADGSSRMERRISVNSLTIGQHTRIDVPMTVSPDGADMLLGLPVLKAIGKFSIDAVNGRLTFS